MSKNKKRLRIIAGPNGSGKSNYFDFLSKELNTGYFINADLIENNLQNKGFINLNHFNIKVTKNDFDDFCNEQESKSLIEKSLKENHKIQLKFIENFIIDSLGSNHKYEGSLIASFIRKQLIKSNQSFSFETVMSHASKLDFIKEAKVLGYATYLYFICIDDTESNISRIANRVKKGGHYVDDLKVINRYPKTLDNLIKAIDICDKSYLYDNSGAEKILIAEIIEGKLILQVDEKNIPNWFINYVLKYFTEI